jgi:hypothetical protein
MILAVIADALQIVVFPLFVAGAGSPADDILDLGMGAVLTYARVMGMKEDTVRRQSNSLRYASAMPAGGEKKKAGNYSHAQP